MDNLFDKIKSYFISNYIFNYIKDDIFRLKLFIYSKHFQNKLNLKVLFKEQYLKKMTLIYLIIYIQILMIKIF